MKLFLFGVTALLLVVAGPAPASDDHAPRLKSDISYYFAMGQGQYRDPSWLLAWEGTVQGDVNGVIRWWFDYAESESPMYVTRWEVLDCDPDDDPILCPHDVPALVVMAGYSAGTNFAPVDGVAEWSGKGVVTFVAPQYAKWFGHRTTEGGSYYLDEGTPTNGTGPFVIYDKPPNKHSKPRTPLTGRHHEDDGDRDDDRGN
jgi:hypothetical protein